MHVEHVVGGHRASLASRRRVRAEDERQRRALTRGALDLDERQVVTASQEVDRRGGDGTIAHRAGGITQPRSSMVQRIHSPGVYRLPTGPAVADSGLRPIPPGGIIRAMATDDSTPAPHATHAHGTDTFRHSYTKDKAQLLRRLARIEGQVRGISRMIEREEYCVDILQQTSALRAAVDSLAVLVLEDHVQGCVRTAAQQGDADRYVEEVVDVVRRTLGRPTRAAVRSS